MMKRAAYILMLMTVILSCKKEGLTMSYSSADISGKPEEHMVLAGFGSAKACFIITGKAEIIARRIMEELDRGATLLSARGAYSLNRCFTSFVA